MRRMAARAVLETKFACSRAPLYYSAREGFTTIVHILTKAGTNKDTPDKDGWEERR
jgi:hypothetical protein